METTLRTTTTGGTGSTLGTRTGAATRPAAAGATKPADDTAASASANSTASTTAPLRSNAGSSQVDGALQDQVARAQQAIDYLDRVSTQLEALKSELTAKLASARGNTTARQAGRQTSSQQHGSAQQLEAQVRQLAATLAARSKNAGGSVDSNLRYTAKPATQNFRIRGLDVSSLKQGAPQSVAFSVGSIGGPQASVSVEPDQSSEEVAAALDRALAPMGLHASLDQNGQLVFSTAEKNWSAVKDSIAISGRGRVSTEEVPASLAPQQWNVGGEDSNTEALRQSLREVVQALERVHHSQTAATNALSSATVQVAAAETPPPEVQLAADDFASAASNTDYDSLLSLTSALVGVSRERVLALLGLN